MATLDIEPKRFSATEYERMAEAGVFSDSERVELLEGVVCTMSPEGRRHVVAVELARKVLTAKLGERAGLRIQHPLRVAEDSEPEPDVAVVPDSDPRAYLGSHPQSALLAIEVAHHSLRRDLGYKAGLYASAGVPEYWVENLVDDTLEVFRDPSEGTYRSRQTFRRGERVSLVAFPDVDVEVQDLLP